MAGNNVWDVLEKTPLVSASEDGSLLLVVPAELSCTSITKRKQYITLSAQNWFKSNKDHYNYELGALRIKDYYYNDTRSVALAISYGFGKQTVKDKRDREIGSQDVKGRLM